MRKLLLVAAGTLAISGSYAAAEPAYTADELVQHFIKSANLGQARAICIGTDEECKAKLNAPLESKDMKVQFELNSAKLLPEAKETLEQFAKAMNDPKLEIATFEVNGHADARGTEIYNEELSVERAQAVAQELVALGVSEDRIKTRGFGKSRPISGDPYADVNRRVETRMVYPTE